MRIAITGASGFIGNHLCGYLADQGHEVIGLHRSGETSKRMEAMGIATGIIDVREADSLKTWFRGADAVIHLAALFNNPEASWGDYFQVNVQGTENVLKASLEQGVQRVVHCSTVGVVLGAGSPPYSEESLLCPAKGDKYETTKCEGERRALEFFPVIVV